MIRFFKKGNKPEDIVVSLYMDMYLDKLASEIVHEEWDKLIRTQVVKELTENPAVREKIVELAGKRLIELLEAK